MATKKGAKKYTSKKASKSYGKSKEPPGGVIRPLYGVVIHDCIARGNKQEMRQLSAAARKHLQDVQAALAKLEAQIGKAG